MKRWIFPVAVFGKLSTSSIQRGYFHGPIFALTCSFSASCKPSDFASARSTTKAFAALGADVTLVGPPTLLPESLVGWPADTSGDLDELIGRLDVIYLLRIQHERQDATLFPSLREYTTRYGLTAERATRLKPDTLVMHPGPMNRGVEIATEVAESPASVITEQVANGVAVRMAVLYRLLGSGAPVA